MKRSWGWVGLIALVLCLSVSWMTGCAKKATLQEGAVVTQEQKAVAQAPAEAAATSAADSKAARDRALRDQALSDQAAREAAEKAAREAAAKQRRRPRRRPTGLRGKPQEKAAAILQGTADCGHQF